MSVELFQDPALFGGTDLRRRIQVLKGGSLDVGSRGLVNRRQKPRAVQGRGVPFFL
jgi:hypothetical protein